VVITWSDQRAGSTNADIFACGLDSTGATTPIWPTNGLLVCGAAGNQITPAIAANGVGQFVLAWSDSRSGQGSAIYAQCIGYAITAVPMAVSQGDGRLRVLAPRPNPGMGPQTIAFLLGSAAPVRVDVFDPQGRHVRTIEAAKAHPGANSVVWDGLDEKGVAVGAGMYFVRVQAGPEWGTTRLTVLR
jgi:hypothetical protein